MKWDNFSSQLDLIRHPVPFHLMTKIKHIISIEKNNAKNWNKTEMRKKEQLSKV